MRRATWQQFDLGLFVAMLILLALGIALIYSAYDHAVLGSDAPLSDYLSINQAWRAAIGLAAYFVVVLLDYHLLFKARWLIYVAMLGMLLATLLMGQTAFGAQRSIQVGETSLQFSELAKVLIIIVLAQTLGQGQEHLESPHPFLMSLLLLIPPVVLVYQQPDLSTTLIMVVTWLGMVFLAGVRWRHILVAAIIGILAAPVIWFRLEDYMRNRVLDYLNPAGASPDESYNVRQALISIGNGGWWGTGLLQGSQSQLYFLRVRHTDFVFSVLAEELGFLGCMGFLFVYAFLIYRLLAIAQQAPDEGGRLLASGTAVMLTVQMLVNLGANMNLLPVTGIPLPLVSYGGSALMTTIVALGLVQSVAVRRQRAESDEITSLRPRTMQRSI